ncbi:hypothetical protein G840_00357 [Escherichia coli HVH 188 (4-2356988)]|nr:hypothetical protein G840_00357 [Escherichia coli HVH 188 (4-2356988)]KLX56931.1 hypothetical protein SK78_02843 [Escherichia coli]
MSFLLPCGGIMNNIDLLKTITNYKKIKNPAYPAQESLLIHLYIREGANKRGNSSRLTQSFHFFMFEPIFSPVNALNQPI